MAYTKNRNITKIALILVVFSFLVNKAMAQESLWKTFNPYPDREVPSYSGGLSPFPQRQEEIEEIEFERVNDPFADFDNYDSEELTSKEKRLILTTSILAEIKQFLAEESAYTPNLDSIVIEAIAKSNGKYMALIQKKWLKMGEEIKVPVDESKVALELLDKLRIADQYLAETVEDAVMKRTGGRNYEVIKIVNINDIEVTLEDSLGKSYTINFVNTPF